MTLRADCVAKLFFGVRTKFSRTAGAPFRKLCGGSHDQSDFQPAAFVRSLQGIGLSNTGFAGRDANFGSQLIFEFCNTIGQERTHAPQQTIALFNHLVGSCEQRVGHAQDWTSISSDRAINFGNERIRNADADLAIVADRASGECGFILEHSHAGSGVRPNFEERLNGRIARSDVVLDGWNAGSTAQPAYGYPGGPAFCYHPRRSGVHPGNVGLKPRERNDE
jgi:hypothetical protein